MSQSSKPTSVARQDPESRSRNMFAALALLLGLLLRLLFIVRFAHLAGDTLVYGDIARNWLEHAVYGLTQTVNGQVVAPHATLIRLPGYPLFLLVCFRLFGTGHYLPVMLVQAALDLAGCWLAASIARRIFGERAFLPALWLAALCPFTANYTAVVLTETVTLFTIQLAFYGLVRWKQAGARFDRWLALIGIALAYSILVRPEQGLLAAAVVPAVYWYGKPGDWKRGLRLAAVVSLLTVLPLVFWAIRNEHTMHVFQPLAPRDAMDPGEVNPSGFQHWYKTWAIDFATTVTTYWNYDSEPVRVGDLPYRAFDNKEQYQETADLLEDYNAELAANEDFDARFEALARERRIANPFRYYVALPASRLVNMILRPRVETLPVPLEWWKVQGHLHTALAALALALVNLGYIVLAFAGWVRWRRSAAESTWQTFLFCMLATIALRAALLLTLDNSEPRYTLEFYPVIFILGAACWTTFRRRRPSSESQTTSYPPLT